MNYEFEDRLDFSKGRLLASHPETITTMIPGCRGVVSSSPQQDRCGIDYIAELESGRTLNIDVKTRDRGCSRYWKNGEPDLALETWSVWRGKQHPQNVVGWTLDIRKQTDLVLFTFDPEDTVACYLLGFHHLRTAFIKFGPLAWLPQYGQRWQATPSRGYRSACVFVPAEHVLAAISKISCGLSRVAGYAEVVQ